MKIKIKYRDLNVNVIICLRKIQMLDIKKKYVLEKLLLNVLWVW